jgi:GntR family transcriptional regulator
MKISRSLGGAVKEDLLKIISSSIKQNTHDDADEHGNRLPSEDELAKRLGVSLATVREALKALETEGYVSKKHGMGNYYHASAFNARMRIDMIMDFSDLLASSGHAVSVKQTDLEPILKTAASLDAYEQHLIETCGTVLRYDRIYEADGTSAIITRNYIPSSVVDVHAFSVRKETSRPELIHENIIGLLWSGFNVRVAHSIETMDAGAATQSEGQLFGISVGTPVIRWSETLYSISDAAVGYADVVFNPMIVRMQLLRKWM